VLVHADLFFGVDNGNALSDFRRDIIKQGGNHRFFPHEDEFQVWIFTAGGCSTFTNLNRTMVSAHGIKSEYQKIPPLSH
jgi:hypothetical protein